jgi:hypothetical protein
MNRYIKINITFDEGKINESIKIDGVSCVEVIGILERIKYELLYGQNEGLQGEKE